MIDDISHLNVMREFDYDPFSILGRKNCTVEALHKASAHINTSPKHGLSGYNPGRKDDQTVTMGEVMKLFAEQAA